MSEAKTNCLFVFSLHKFKEKNTKQVISEKGQISNNFN